MFESLKRAVAKFALDSFLKGEDDIAWSGRLITQIADSYAAYEEAYKRVVWVNRCVNLIARTIASVPLKLYDKSGGEVEDHAALRAFSEGNKGSYHKLIVATEVALKLYGNCYWYLDYLSTGEPMEIYWLQPRHVIPEPSKKPDEVISQYVHNRKDHYKPEDVVHFMNFDPSNPCLGKSPLVAARSAIGLEYASIDYNKGILINAGRPEGILSTEKSLTKPEIDMIKMEWRQQYSGARNVGKTPVLMKNLKYLPIAIPPRDLQWAELRASIRQEICAVLGVPPVMVGAYETSTYATAKEQQESYWTDTILPELASVQDMLTEHYLKQFKNSEGYVFKFDLSKIPALMERTARLYDAMSNAINSGLLLRDEARGFLDMLPVPGGDKFLVPAMSVFIEDLL